MRACMCARMYVLQAQALELNTLYIPSRVPYSGGTGSQSQMLGTRCCRKLRDGTAPLLKGFPGRMWFQGFLSITSNDVYTVQWNM